MEKILPKSLLNRFFLKNYRRIRYIPVAKKVVYMYADMENMIIQYQLVFTLVKKYKFYNVIIECRKRILEDHQHARGVLFVDMHNIFINGNFLSNNREIEIIPTSLRNSKSVVFDAILLTRREVSRIYIYTFTNDPTLSTKTSSYTTVMEYNYDNLYNYKKQNKIKIYKRAKYIFDAIIDNNNLKFNKIKIV